jgi:hypothetical protein
MTTYCVTLLLLDQFLFPQPYFTVYVPDTRQGLFVINILLSILTGFIAAASIRAARSNTAGGAVRVGLFGVFAAIFAGACPCFYLAPMLAVAGGLGGVLGIIGIFFSTYEVPIKLVATIMLLLAFYGLEKANRTQCTVP